jgi:hypothetical protein
MANEMTDVSASSTIVPKIACSARARGTYTITGLMTGLEQPQDRIKYFSEDFERVAFENELSAELSGLSGHARIDLHFPLDRILQRLGCCSRPRIICPSLCRGLSRPTPPFGSRTKHLGRIKSRRGARTAQNRSTASATVLATIALRAPIIPASKSTAGIRDS